MRYPEPLLQLVSVLKKLPGVGSKTAERFAFELIQWPEEKLQELSSVVGGIKKKLQSCPQCGGLIDRLPCFFCDPARRDPATLCVVASAKDVFLIEDTREYKGYYHVLGSLLNPLQGKIIDIFRLLKRIESLQVREVIMALDSTLEGDATALYLKKGLEACKEVRISRLALGLPMGSPLDFIDGGTLARAFSGRSSY